MAAGNYAKAVIGTVAAAAAAAYTALEGDNRLDAVEAITVVSTLVVGFAAIAASSPWKLAKYMKAAAAAVVAAFAQIVLSLPGLDARDVLAAFLAAVAAGGLTAYVPNAARSDVYRPRAADLA